MLVKRFQTKAESSLSPNGNGDDGNATMMEIALGLPMALLVARRSHANGSRYSFKVFLLPLRPYVARSLLQAFVLATPCGIAADCCPPVSCKWFTIQL